MSDADKSLAAASAADEVRSGMIVGLGTGTTVAQLIPILAARSLDIVTVATSRATEDAARNAGIRVEAFTDHALVDLTIDGVDEIDGVFRAIKGGGGAMLREKIVATASRWMVAIADGSKRVATLGARPVPVEILPFARAFLIRAVESLGAAATLRMAGDAPTLTDQGNWIIDCAFGPIDDPARIAAHLSEIPGILGHGLFLNEIDALYLADQGVVTRHERSQLPG